MPERRFDTAYWSDPFVMKLPAKANIPALFRDMAIAKRGGG